MNASWLDEVDEVLEKAKGSGKDYRKIGERSLKSIDRMGGGLQEASRALRKLVLPRMEEVQSRCRLTNLPCKVDVERVLVSCEGDELLTKIALNVEGLGRLSFEADQGKGSILVKEEILNPRISSPLGERITRDMSLLAADFTEDEIKAILRNFLQRTLGAE